LGEIEQAEQGEIAELVCDAHMRGDLHMHSTASDGRVDIAGMARAAGDRGYAYIAICDHSKSAGYANGLTEARVRDQWGEIDRVNGAGGDVRVLKGIEVDILGDGQVDFGDDLLSEFDLVIASVHSRFRMTQEEATERIVRAVRNPHVDILGHPSGRLLLTREGYPLDTRAVIDAAAESGTAIELNANPHRLDLDWRHLGHARERGVKIAINTDAHSVEGLDDMRYGTGIARKGGLGPGDVLNALELDALLECLKRHA
jgi:DNA polymerase (family 10)